MTSFALLEFLATTTAFSPFSTPTYAFEQSDLDKGTLESAVNIAFTPSSGNSTLSPTGDSGASGLISVLADVGVTNSGGYEVYLGSNSQNLVGQTTKYIIPGVSGTVTLDNLASNTWGYYAGQGSVIPGSATFKAITAGQGEKIYSNSASRIAQDDQTFILAFATNINKNVPADIYENQVTLSVVSSPYQITLLDIDSMQEMTSAVCGNTPRHASKRLQDERDKKYYWVTKLADDKCWMTQNLAFNLNNTTLSPETSDVTSSWTPNVSSALWTGDRNTANAINFYNPGEYVYTTPTALNNCGGTSAKISSLSQCSAHAWTSTSGKTASDNPDLTAVIEADKYNAHYLAGNYYSWMAATANTGKGVKDKVSAPGSICPSGWQLPPLSGAGSFDVAFTSYGAQQSGTTIFGSQDVRSLPIAVTYSGTVISSLFRNAGADAYFWTSASDGGSGAYGTVITSVATTIGKDSFWRYMGLSVRCVAR